MTTTPETEQNKEECIVFSDSYQEALLAGENIAKGWEALETNARFWRRFAFASAALFFGALALTCFVQVQSLVVEKETLLEIRNLLEHVKNKF